MPSFTDNAITSTFMAEAHLDNRKSATVESLPPETPTETLLG